MNFGGQCGFNKVEEILIKRENTPASEDFGQEHAVDSFGWALGEVVGVDGLACKVGALAKHGGMFAADARVKVVLADAFHDVGRGTVEEVPLTQQPVHLWQTPRHVLLLPVREGEGWGEVELIHKREFIAIKTEVGSQ